MTARAGGADAGGFSLDAVREQCRTALFDDFLPFMDRHVVDHEHGGFMCHADRDGARVSTLKRAWFEGRGIWVYSFLYNRFGRDARHLEIARRSAEFVLRLRPAGDAFFPGTFTREGEPFEEADPPFFGTTTIYGDLFIATGLAEYATAAGDPRYRRVARELLFRCLDVYDNRPGYSSLPPAGGDPAVPSPRILGHWMIFLRLATEMLSAGPDPEIEAVAARCVDAVMNRHLNPEYGLLNEHLNHDMSRIAGDRGQVATGHGPETLWMVLDEAVRTGNRELFDRAADCLRRHLEVLWDDVYGGFFAGLRHVERGIPDTGKWLWVQVEALIGLMLVIEHRDARWAKEWYARVEGYTRGTLLLERFGLPLWNFQTDRRGTFERHTDRIEHFHLPRYLMLTLLAADRMAGGRNGPKG